MQKVRRIYDFFHFFLFNHIHLRKTCVYKALLDDVNKEGNGVTIRDVMQKSAKPSSQ